MNAKFLQRAASTSLALLMSACVGANAKLSKPKKLTAEDAVTFVEEAEKRLEGLYYESSLAAWVRSTYITYDSQQLEAIVGERSTVAAVEYAKQAFQYDGLSVPDDVRRKLSLLKLGLTAPAPKDPAKSKEMATIGVHLEASYGEGKYCPKTGECLDIEQIEGILFKERDPKKLREMWEGWHQVGAPMRKDYARFVELSNEGAQQLGYKDTGAMWRSKYDMPPDEFAQEMDRLWGQVKPLYDSLHCYTRWKLVEKYGPDVVPPNGPIPAHLLGNLWAQDWSGIYDILAPADTSTGYDLTELLKAKKVDELEMVRYGERFFTSLGFDPLPKTFWERSLFLKPRDRNVVCHASAWDVDNVEDLRLKMCIDVNEEDFRTIHHELGHNFYQRAYNKQPLLFRDSANDGFHEAIGDTIALSVTPGYLVKVGLLDKEPDTSKDIALLLHDALEKVSFLPFGLLVDRWRWGVFSGEIKPEQYNKAWWDLKLKYQGVAPPSVRGEEYFDPGAKYHVPANTPYSRYFLAAILQVQFHRALCKIAGQSGPLNRCSIYGNKEAGKRLNDMLAMGVSKPWPDALESLTGQRQMDATAMIDYFAPLKTWLDIQNKGKTCGW
jgi:peptidyl-dipeptidase A